MNDQITWRARATGTSIRRHLFLGALTAEHTFSAEEMQCFLLWTKKVVVVGGGK